MSNSICKRCHRLKDVGRDGYCAGCSSDLRAAERRRAAAERPTDPPPPPADDEPPASA